MKVYQYDDDGLVEIPMVEIPTVKVPMVELEDVQIIDFGGSRKVELPHAPDEY